MITLHSCKTYQEALDRAGALAAAFGKDPSERLFAFSEDKLTMSLEREIAAKCGGGTFNVEVMTFSRFIHRFSRDLGVVLDKESSAMAVKRIMLTLRDELKCFKKSAYNPGTAVTMYELIAQLKSACVSPEELLQGLGNLSGVLKGKIQDIIIVYSAYEDFVKEQGYLDSNSYLSLMTDILNGRDFAGCSAMLVGFNSLTRQGMNIVRALSERMDNLDVFLLSGENSELYTNELKEALMREIGGVFVAEGGADYSKEHLAIMQGLFEPSRLNGGGVETDKIYFYEAEDCEEEIRHVASVIRRSVISGMRYKDIAVAVGNLADYSRTVSRVFAEYGIPYFYDDPRVLSTHPISALAVKYLDLIRGRLQPEDFIDFEKNPYRQQDRAVSDRIERFIKKNAITAKTIKNGLNRERIDDYGADADLFEEERALTLSLICDCKMVSDYVRAIKSLYGALGVKEMADCHVERLRAFNDHAAAAFTAQAYAKAEGVLDSVDRMLGSVEMGVADFRNLLISGFAACKVSVLPQASDAVYVGDYKECKYLEHKILFAAGLNGDVPFTKSDTAVLTDRDLNKLERFDCIVEPKIRIVNRRERENVGAALLSFKDRLYLSRSAVDGEGRPAAKSRVTDYFTSMFTRGGKPIHAVTRAELERRARDGEGFLRNLTAISYNAPVPAMKNFLSGAALYREGVKDDFNAEAAFFNVLRRNSPEEADRAEEYLALSGSQPATELKQGGELVFRRGSISASILESYFSCPFACFARYGLRLNESDDGELKINEFGTLLHSAMEEHIKLLIEDGDKESKTVCDRLTSDRAVEGIMQELMQDFRYARFEDADRYRVIFKFVEREAKRVAYELFEQLKKSGYRPVETEAVFRDGARYPALRIDTPYGVKKINGMIDRVDRCGSYVRVIDYKTGKTHDEDENFYTGNNVQLYLYMNAFISEGDVPAGAYYFPVSDKFEKDGESTYALRGKTLAETDAVIAADSSVTGDGGESRTLGTTFKSKGNGLDFARKKGFITKEDFNAYLKYARLIASQGASELLDGVIAPSPYEGKCKYCRYSAICGFDTQAGEYRKERGVNPQTIAEAVEVYDETDR